MNLFKIIFFVAYLITSLYSQSPNEKEEILAIHPLTAFLLKNSSNVVLNKNEIDFLAKHPQINIGSDAKWLPYVYKTKDQKIIGFNVDILNKINEITGSNFQFKLGVWDDIVKKAKEKKVDGITPSVVHKERAKFFNFSLPFSTHSLNVVVKHGNPLDIKSKKDLVNKTIVIQKGNLFLEKLTKKIFPNSIIIYKNSYESVFQEVVFGQADATINEAPIAFLKNENGLPYLNIAFSLNEKSELVFSVRKDWPEAISILNKGIKAIPKEELEIIYHKWFGDFKFNIYSKDLSQMDKEYIKKKERVRACTDSTWYAFNKEDTNKESITTRFLDVVLKKIGLEKDLVFTSTWKESLFLLKHRECDLISAILKNDELEDYVKFTKPYTNYPNMLITHANTPYLYSLDELKGKKIALIKESFVIKYFKDKYKDMQFVYISNPYEGLQKVQNKEVFAYIDLLPKFISVFNDMKDIKINRELDTSMNISMGVRSDDERLFNIIEKSLNTMSETEKHKIFSKLFKEESEKRIDSQKVLQVVFILLGLILMVFIWNLQLKRSVEKALLKNKKQEGLLYYYSKQDAMKDLVGNISHQWKQPVNELSSILFFLETKLHLNQEITQEEIKDTSHKSRIIIDYLSKTVSSFSEFYLNKESESDIKILTLLEQSIFITEGSLNKYRTKINLDIQDESLKVKGEELQQVLLAILNNAKNIIIERKVSNPIINIKLYKEEKKSIIEIRDNLGGVKNVDDIFKLGITSRENGTGLGLYISKRIIKDKYKGDIFVSNEDLGAIFYIKLPNF